MRTKYWGDILRDNVNDKDIKIYEMYLRRIQHAYDLFWIRFKIFFGFNSGVLIIIGLIIQPYLTPNCFNFPKCSEIVI